MAIYGLQNTSSLDIISLFQYDGSGSISVPSGGFQLYSESYVPGTDYILNMFTASEYNLIDDLDGVLMATFKSLDGGEVIGTLDLSGSLVVTGSVSISGSFNINGEKFDEVFKIAPKPCTILKYEEDVINQLPTDGGLNPQGGYFIFNIDTSLNGDYSENSWRIQKPTKIRMNLQTLGDSLQQNEYETQLFDIIKNRFGDSEILLEQILENNAIQSAIKKFKIVRGIYRERSRRKDVDGVYRVKYYYMDWGEKRFTETDQFFGQEDIDYFYGLDFNQIGGPDSARDGFFEFDVVQIEPLNVNPQIKPEQDAEFSICVTPKVVLREVTVFTESGDYNVPTWCNKLTMVAIGAGGGGGGGSWGYPKVFEAAIPDGFDIATGGGGGAGGAVAKSSFNLEGFKRNDIIPGYSKLNVLVGASGKGGVGLDYQFPYKPVMEVYTIGDYSGQNYLFSDATNDSDTLNIPSYNGDYLPKYFGKQGGFSAVYTATSGKTLVKAEGGTGGNPGVALKSGDTFWTEFHEGGCRTDKHTYDKGLRNFGVPSSLVLGGQSSMKNSFGTDYLVSGGPGGYGFHTIPFFRVIESTINDWRNQPSLAQRYFNPTMFNMNNAPSIPNDNANNRDLKFYDSKKYFVRKSNDMSNTFESVRKLFERQYLDEFALNLAPPGGGGGFGVRTYELNEILPHSTWSSWTQRIISKWLVPNDFDVKLPETEYYDYDNIIKKEPEIFAYGTNKSEYTEPLQYNLLFKNTNPSISTEEVNESTIKNVKGFIKINNCSSPNDKQLDLVFVSNRLNPNVLIGEYKMGTGNNKIFNTPDGYPNREDIRKYGRMYLYPPFNDDWDVEPLQGEIILQFSPTNGSLSGQAPNNPPPNTAITNKTIVVKIHTRDKNGNDFEPQILGVINAINGGFRLRGLSSPKFGTHSLFFEGSDGKFYPDPNDRTKDVDATRYVFRKVNDYYIFELDVFGAYSNGKMFVFSENTPSDRIFTSVNPIDVINPQTMDEKDLKQYLDDIRISSSNTIEFVNLRIDQNKDITHLLEIPSSTKTIIVSNTKETGVVTGIYNVTGPFTTENITYDGDKYAHLTIPVEEIVAANNVSYTSTYDNISNMAEDSKVNVAFSSVSFYTDADRTKITSTKPDEFIIVPPFDGIQRFATADKYANLGLGGRLKTASNVLLYEIGTDNNGNPTNLTIGNGGNGGFGQYFSIGRGIEMRPELSNTLPEDVSNRWGVGGGGGAAVFLKENNDKNRIGDPDVPTKGQDGADGGPGIVVIIAEVV